MYWKKRVCALYRSIVKSGNFKTPTDAMEIMFE
jgi:hypothetical protein